ncbi:hypothetical protein ACFWPH_22060 [Nocardia sp. NPDC058499]|uniref:hypothetical protein n=1 Tax=Nocardia sp. NPDC058499 TaxID=3346530 RepID=UPI00365E5DFA
MEARPQILLAESVLLIGAFVPTLTLMPTAGALARTGHLQLPLVITVAAAAVVLGDFLSRRTGRLAATQQLHSQRTLNPRVPPSN